MPPELIEKYGADGSKAGRTLGLISLVLGIGTMLLSWAIFGAVLGVIAIVIAIVAIVMSARAKRAVKAAGGTPRTGGAKGLAIIGIVTSAIGIAIAVFLLVLANDLIENCQQYQDDQEQYIECLQERLPASDE